MLHFPHRNASRSASALRDLRVKNGQFNATKVALGNLIYSHPKLAGLGGDPMLNQMMRAVGFKDTDFVAERVAVKGKVVVVIVLPRHLWRNAEIRHEALRVKADAASLRARCIVIPHSSIAGNLRARVAAKIAQGRSARYGAHHVDAVVEHVSRARITTIADCARVMPRHVDPFAVVLAMIARGFLDIDRDQPVTFDSWVTTVL